MKKKRLPKLTLKKTTIRQLTDVSGGVPPFTDTTCTSYTGCPTVAQFTCGDCATIEG